MECLEETAIVQRTRMVKLMRNLREHVVANGLKKVPCGVAMERAEICAGCPHNVAEITEGGRVFYELLRWLRGFWSPLETTGHEAEIDYCAKSHWALELKVWLPEETLRETAERQVRYPDHCWMKHS